MLLIGGFTAMLSGRVINSTVFAFNSASELTQSFRFIENASPRHLLSLEHLPDLDFVLKTRKAVTNMGDV